jgi:hypothetical protein
MVQPQSLGRQDDGRGRWARRRARMLRMTSLEWSSALSASVQAASTASSPSVNTAPRMSTICRSPSSTAASLRRTRSIAPGNSQFLNGAPLRYCAARSNCESASKRDPTRDRPQHLDTTKEILFRVGSRSAPIGTPTSGVLANDLSDLLLFWPGSRFGADSHSRYYYSVGKRPL